MSDDTFTAPNQPLEPTPSEVNWGIGAHLSSVVTIGLVAGASGVIGPLLVWLFKGKDSEFIRRNGLEAINFNITILLGIAISYALVGLVIGIFLFPVVIVIYLVLTIRACLDVRKGNVHHYPYILRLVKDNQA